MSVGRNNQTRKNAATTRGRPFEKGNPGRTRGARHRVTRAVEALLEGEHEALTRKAIEKALDGDITALRLCLERIAPPRKGSPITFVLPTIRSAQDVVGGSASLLAAVASGEVTPAEADRVMSLLLGHRSIVEA